MNAHNSIDLLIIILLGIFCIKGFFRGILIEVFTLAGLILAYILAIREMSTIEHWINQFIRVPPLIASSIGFLLIFLCIGFLFRWIAMLLRSMAKWSILGWLDKGGGLLFGLFKGALIGSLILLLLSLIPFSSRFQQEREKSILYKPLCSVAPAIFNFAMRTFPSTKDFYEELKESLSIKSKEVTDQIIEEQVDEIEKEIEQRVTGE